jgi:ADP-ribose pyrophosphatase YjhB (NUDIX family)
VGVGARVLDGARVLLVRRTVDPGRGRWCLPAGYLDPGEHPERTAVREVLEETGLEVRITDLAGVFHTPPPPFGKQGATLFVLYDAERTGGRLAAGDDADQAGFFDADSLPELAFESTRTAVAELTTGSRLGGRIDDPGETT